MLIDCSYFTQGPRHIENASMGALPNANAVEVCKAIEAYIDQYQEDFLVRMLGSKVGNKVNAYLVCLDEDEAPKHNEHFDELCDKLRESFADYVFYHILRDTSTQATITGIVKLKCANDYVSPLRTQVWVWNRMVNRNRLFADWCNSEECAVSDISISGAMTTKVNVFNL